MLCSSCNKENKEDARLCRHCGEELIKSWQPTWKWHIKTLAIIFMSLVIIYLFLVKVVLK